MQVNNKAHLHRFVFCCSDAIGSLVHSTTSSIHSQQGRVGRWMDDVVEWGEKTDFVREL